MVINFSTIFRVELMNMSLLPIKILILMCQSMLQKKLFP